jgi:HlyD family secretion protein
MTTNPKHPFRKFLWITAGLVLCAGTYAFLPKNAAPSYKSTLPSAPLTIAAATSLFLQEVLERGEVGSSSNVDIRCQVQSKVLTGTPIIQIVPEGTYVQEGDFLVKLDDSGIQADVLQQQITCNSSRALEVEGRADYEAAKLALEEYE